ncbi:MAG: SMP-30/gluconolactonase/LRE family protein [Planctomycetota bacterium]
MRVGFRGWKKWFTFPVLLASAWLRLPANAQDDAASWVTETQDASVQLVSDQFKFTEGPTADTGGNVYFTDQPSNRISLWKTDGTVVDFLSPAGRSNGLYFALDGKLIACADESNQMWEIGSDGSHRILLEGFEGKRLNGPNDVWLDSNGTIYFTDPYYQRPWWTHQKPELAKQSIYKADRDGSNIVCVDDALVKPNGIVGDSSKRIIFVADIGDGKTYKYQIGSDGSLLDREVFCRRGSDGMTLDKAGNVFLTGSDGVYVYNARGEPIQTIRVPESWTANVCLGGEDRRTLFITAMDSVYTIRVKYPGVGSK